MEPCFFETKPKVFNHSNQSKLKYLKKELNPNKKDK